MRYTEEQLKRVVLAALEDAGYYHSQWVESGTNEDKEKKCYYNGRADSLVMIYGVQDFENTEEAKAAYSRGKNRYYNDNDDE